jgi:hypothetical protein
LLPFSLRPSVPLSLRPSILPSLRPSVPLSLRPSVPPSLHPSIPPSLCPSVPLSHRPFVPLSLCPSVPPSLRPSFPTSLHCLSVPSSLIYCLFVPSSLSLLSSLFVTSLLHCFVPSSLSLHPSLFLAHPNFFFRLKSTRTKPQGPPTEIQLRKFSIIEKSNLPSPAFVVPCILTSSQPTGPGRFKNYKIFDNCFFVFTLSMGQAKRGGRRTRLLIFGI